MSFYFFHSNLREELMDGPLHPAVQCGRKERAVQARAAEFDEQRVAFERDEFHRPAVKLLNVRAQVFDKASKLNFFIEYGWCGHWIFLSQAF